MGCFYSLNLSSTPASLYFNFLLALIILSLYIKYISDERMCEFMSIDNFKINIIRQNNRYLYFEVEIENVTMKGKS